MLATSSSASSSAAPQASGSSYAAVAVTKSAHFSIRFFPRAILTCSIRSRTGLQRTAINEPARPIKLGIVVCGRRGKYSRFRMPSYYDRASLIRTNHFIRPATRRFESSDHSIRTRAGLQRTPVIEQAHTREPPRRKNSPATTAYE